VPRFHDRLRVRGVVLLPLDERLDVARRDQSHLKAEPVHFARPVMRPAVSLHRDDECGCSDMNRWNCGRDSFLRKTTAPSAAALCSWNTFFVRSTPMMATSFDAVWNALHIEEAFETVDRWLNRAPVCTLRQALLDLGGISGGLQRLAGDEALVVASEASANLAGSGRAASAFSE
jgi:hypothetical protein